MMGAGSSRERLSRADMEFLLLHTHYDEKTIQGRDTLHFLVLLALIKIELRAEESLSIRL